MYIYILTLYTLTLTLGLVLQNIIYNETYIIFNFGLVIDYYSTIVKAILLFLTIIALIISYRKIKMSFIDLIEYPWFIGISVFFLMLLISSFSMITLYLSIEGLSLTLYILTAYPFSKSSMEAASKYYVFGAWSSGVLLLGIVLSYGLFGAFDFLSISQTEIYSYKMLKDVSTFLIVFGFIFKLGMYPFHMWAFDVYEGTWFPVTFFFMTVIKTGIFCLFIKVIFYLFQSVWLVKYLLVFSGIGSLIVGSLGSLTQIKLKKLFLYSSISQVGFCFFGLFLGTPEAIQKTFLFFSFYMITSVGILIILLNTESYIQGVSLKYVTDLSSFGEHNRAEAIALSVMLLSLAGIPPLAGFWSKLFIFKLLIEASLFNLVIFGIVFSAINAFIYIKLIKCLLFDKYIIKTESVSTDFFLFNLYGSYFKFNNWILNLIVLFTTLFICIIPIDINGFLIYLKQISNSSIGINVTSVVAQYVTL